MSEGQTTPQYTASWYGRYEHYSMPFSVHGPDGRIVDAFRTEASARYAASLLNRGVARVDSHAIVGCKVVAS